MCSLQVPMCRLTLVPCPTNMPPSRREGRRLEWRFAVVCVWFLGGSHLSVPSFVKLAGVEGQGLGSGRKGRVPADLAWP
jgi:hypothetical protein